MIKTQKKDGFTFTEEHADVAQYFLSAHLCESMKLGAQIIMLSPEMQQLISDAMYHYTIILKKRLENKVTV